MIRATLLAIGLSLSTEAAIAQTPIELQGAAQADIPRAADGRPDLGGFWATSFITGIGRLEGATKLVVSDEEAKALTSAWVAMANSPELATVVDPDFFVAGIDDLSKVNGEWRTSLITSPADGVQHYTEQGKKLDAQRKAWNNAPADGHEMRTPFDRCLVGLGGAPLTPVPSTMIRQFVQTPDHVVLYTETNDVRIARMDAAPRPAAITSLMGDSIARWEGDTLVVETTGVKDRVIGNLITRPQSRVIERFSMLGADEVLYRFTVEDTAIYAEPWSAEYVLHRSDKPMFEYACHEGNYGLVNILQAGRVAFEREAKAKKAKRSAS